MSSRRRFICGCGALALAGCGGGGSGNDEAASVADSTPAPVATAPPEAATAPGSAASVQSVPEGFTPAGASGASGATSTEVKGCGVAAFMLAGAGIGKLGCRLFSSSGDTAVDARFNAELPPMRAYYGWSGAFSWLDECDKGPNAFALPDTKEIYYGLQLYQQLNKLHGGLSHEFILAHEMAHQKQYENGWYNFRAPTVRDSELIADALGAIYLFLTKVRTGDAAEQTAFFHAMHTAFSMGEFAFNKHSHHGTPLQRAHMVLVGGEMALAIITKQMENAWPVLHAYASARMVQILANPEFAKPTTPLVGMVGTPAVKKIFESPVWARLGAGAGSLYALKPPKVRAAFA